MKKLSFHSLPFLPLTVLLAFPVLAAPVAKVVDPDFLPPVVNGPIPKLAPHAFEWKQMKFDLPYAVKVFEGNAVNADGEPLKAWYALIDYRDPNLQLRSVLSTSSTGRDTTSALARQNGALLAINGSYFDMKKVPAPTYSVVISDGKLLSHSIVTQKRDNKIYPVLRAAFGVKPNRGFDFTWVGHPDGATYSYPSPLPNTATEISPPATKSFPAGGKPWHVTEAMGGGPMLVKKGAPFVSYDAEVLAGSHSLKRHPRTAVGVNKKGRLVLFVVDGRQPLHSMGMTCDELAKAMLDLDCVEAVNLDGGGSSTFVVGNKVINKPSDGPERSVTAIVALDAVK